MHTVVGSAVRTLNPTFVRFAAKVANVINSRANRAAVEKVRENPPLKLHEALQYVNGQYPVPIPVLEDLVDALAGSGNVCEALETRVFRTRTHQQIFDILQIQSRGLMTGSFKGTIGPPTKTMTGPKGIGKSTVAQAYVQLLPLFYDDVIPLYLSWHGVTETSRTWMSKQRLGDILAQYLQEIDVAVPAATEHSDRIDEVLEVLERKNKRLFLVLDEMDEFFKCDTDSAPETLSDLQVISESRSGRISVLLCGSSSSLMSLVTGKSAADPDMMKRFKVLKHERNLNSQKYAQMPVLAALPNDLEAIRGVLHGAQFNWDSEECKQLAAVLMFAGGSNPRELQSLFSVLQGSAEPESFVFMTTSFAKRAAAEHTYQHTEGFINSLLDSFYRSNRHLFDPIIKYVGTRDKYTLDLETIAQSDWKTFVPLEPKQYNKAFQEVFPTVPKREVAPMVSKYLKLLTDHGWLVTETDYQTGGLPNALYPIKFVDVAARFMEKNGANASITTRQLFDNVVSVVKPVRTLLSLAKEVGFRSSTKE
eukprot:TRINITY_DN1225_c0_g1_i3.p1 TRINITY_DN1225_c0_g1~~TRINITY_DN1225_c0_g1_i3.p1  ORF type:complete len:535 (-),score=100.87 TRINITY_DN1225_c0_g1_i3:807-2411(-)